MSDPTGNNFDVHIGFWTNWARGPIRGATFTLTRTNGQVIVSILAIFVALVGRSFWRIACRVIHHVLSQDNPQDGLYHQRQAILRNATTASDGTYHLIWALTAWKGKTKGWSLRLLPLATFALACSTLFALAGTFSSALFISENTAVRLTGKNCAFLLPAGISSAALDQNTNQRAQAAVNYALQCYRNSSSPSSAGNCGTFVKKTLQSTVTRNATCPFSEDICLLKSGNLLIDTGFIDSQDDLGINSQPDGKFLYRTVTQCAPLVTNGFKRAENVTTPTGVLQMMRYYYGPLRLPIGNQTLSYQYPIKAPLDDVPHNSISSSIGDYSLGALLSEGFTPIRQLQRRDAKVTLYFLSANDMTFFEKTSDPWFSANKELGTFSFVNVTDGSLFNRTYYGTDEPANVVGCAVSEQFCNPNLPEATRCEPLRRADNLLPASTIQLWPNERTQLLARWSIRNMFLMRLNVWYLVNSLGSSILLARQRLGGGQQQPLPNNQWQLEMEHWHSASLASLQAVFVDTSVGITDPLLEEEAVRPNNETAYERCQNQKILSDAYASFSVLGLFLVIGIGLGIIVLDSTVDYVYVWIQKRYNISPYSRLEWATSSTLQLQRLAHEAIGSGTWIKGSDTIPITTAEVKLSALDISNTKHPVLRSTTMKNEESSPLVATASMAERDNTTP